jgi:hypothetical protein
VGSPNLDVGIEDEPGYSLWQKLLRQGETLRVQIQI